MNTLVDIIISGMKYFNVYEPALKCIYDPTDFNEKMDRQIEIMNRKIIRDKKNFERHRAVSNKLIEKLEKF